jgi:membrane-associated phospholipid phosphatase
MDGKAASGSWPLISNPRRGLWALAVLGLAAAMIFVLVALDSTHAWVQRVDDRVLVAMVSNRWPPVTVVARALNLLGSVWVMLPLRLLVAGYLAVRRRWLHFTAFVVAMAGSEIVTQTSRALYRRPRPQISLALVRTTGASFPSGHAAATSVVALMLVLVLLPPGRRAAASVAAAAFTVAMAISRMYLAAHWLSDALGGVVLGAAIAVASALAVQAMWDARHRGVTSAAVGDSVLGPEGDLR